MPPAISSNCSLLSPLENPTPERLFAPLMRSPMISREWRLPRRASSEERGIAATRNQVEIVWLARPSRKRPVGVEGKGRPFPSTPTGRLRDGLASQTSGEIAVGIKKMPGECKLNLYHVTHA